MIKKNFLKLLALSIFAFFHLLIIQNLHFPALKNETILLTDLLGNGLTFSVNLVLVVSLLNMFLIWLITNILYGEKVADLGALIYAISPWVFYTDSSGSIFVIATSLLLITFLGFLELSRNRKLPGLLLTLIPIVILFYLNILMWVALPFLIAGFLYIERFQKIKKTFLCALLVALVPLLIMSFHNKVGIINVAKNNFGFSEEVSVLTSINVFRGETNGTIYQRFGHVYENRYVGFLELFIFSFLKQLTPATYFTNQAKLLSYSFSPPIMLGFLFPFLMGLLQIWRGKISNVSKLLFFSGLLIPSTFSLQTPDLERLFILSPLIFVTIALGINQSLSSKNRIVKLLILFSLVLVSIQLLTTLSDISIKESVRLQRYINGN